MICYFGNIATDFNTLLNPTTKLALFFESANILTIFLKKFATNPKFSLCLLYITAILSKSFIQT